MIEWWNSQAERYGSAQDLEEQVRERAATAVLRLSARQAGRLRVLELGCGNGRLLQKVAERLDGRAVLVGVDSAPGMVAEARRLVPEARIEQQELLDAAARADWQGYFDAVLICNTLHNLPGEHAIRQALTAAARLLAPGGELIFDVRNRSNPFIRRGYRKSRSQGLDFHPTSPFTLGRLLEPLGLVARERGAVCYRSVAEAGRSGWSWPKRWMYGVYLLMTRAATFAPYVFCRFERPGQFVSVIWGYHSQFYGFSKVQNYHLSVVDLARQLGYRTVILSMGERADITKDPNFDTQTEVVRYRSLWQFFRFLRRHRHSTVYANSVVWQNFLLPFICRRAVFMAHDSIRRRSAFKQWLENLALRAYWRVRVIAPGERDFLERQGIDPKKVFVVPIAVDTSLFTYRETERRDIVHLANVTPDYDIPTVLRAFAEARRQVPGVRLHTIGEVRVPEFRSLVSSLGLGDAVVDHGALPHSKIAELLPGFAVYVTSVISSGQTLAAFEAALSGCALCLPDTMQFNSVFLGAALLHPLHDHRRLAENLVRYLQGESLARQHNAVARALIEQGYSQSTVNRKLRELFNF